MSISSLASRLTQLSDAHKTTSALIDRLSKLPGQPGSYPLDPAAADTRLELSTEIHQRLKEQADALELVRQEVNDLPGPTALRRTSRGPGGEHEGERARLEIGVNRLSEDLRSAHSHFRKAQLQAKRNAELARRQERQLLFADVQDGTDKRAAATARRRGGAGQEKLSQDELAVNASQDVTAALRRTHQLLQSELSRSQFAHDTLQQSTAALTSLSESYTTLDSLLSSSRTLLGSLLRSQKSDTWYLETAFYILVSTIVWLVFRRFLYGPLWWFLWLPLKLGYRLCVGVLAAVGILGKGSVDNAAGSASTSLIVKPSATGGFPRWDMASGQRPSMVVGGGGRGAGGGEDTPNQGQKSLADEVGQMAEQTQKEGKGESGGDGQAAGSVTEGGNPEDVPRNPKKRMWEEDKEAQKMEAASKGKDEL